MGLVSTEVVVAVVAVARVSKWLAIGLLGGYVFLAALFAAGEALSDPGGWLGVGLVALWTLPVATSAVIAWRKPDAVVRPLAVILAGVVGLDAWAGLTPAAWTSFENGAGPVRAVVSLSLAGVLLVLALKRTAPAALMLAVLGFFPLVVAQFHHGRGSAPLAVLSAPVALAGVLLAVSTILVRPTLRPGQTGPVPPQHEAA